LKSKHSSTTWINNTLTPVQTLSHTLHITSTRSSTHHEHNSSSLFSSNTR